MKNILIITPFFPPNIGGVESFMSSLCKHYQQKNIKSTVLTLKPVTTFVKAKDFELINKKMTKVYRFSFFSSHLYHKSENNIFFNFIFIFPYFFLKVIAFIAFKKKEKYDLISAHGFHSLLISFFLKKILRINCNFFAHSTYDNFKKSPLKRFLFTFLLKIPNKIFCNSLKTKELIKKFSKKKKLICFDITLMITLNI